METAPTQSCPSRPALRPNCQIYPLPFTSQCGALGSAMGQAIGIDTSQAKHVSCRKDILSQERAPVADVPRAEQFPIDCPTHQHDNNPQFSSSGEQSILTFSNRSELKYSSNKINQRSDRLSNHREKSNFKSKASGLFFGWRGE